ncbi:MAG TPA: lipocalin-like domain-containing protein [Vicinamibacterales bacterium]|nr:lipocalin-like domain-containing protein [Vicinamibacterales bacterium]
MTNKTSRVPGVPRVPRVGFVAVLVLLAVGLAAGQSPWKQATAGYKFAFPRDHASHPDYKIEWWYYTGNVTAKDGRRFGYQVTWFRVGIDHTPSNPSRWTIRDLYMTHLAVSDAAGQRYRFSEKLSRGGPGIAGAATDRYHVWNEDWTGTLNDRGQHVLKAMGKNAGIDLVLDEGKPPATNGVNGISQKGARDGNASHYYSVTRMPTRGTIVVDGERVEVEGLTWMDHEFGTSFLEPEQRGWDWLAVQLSDGRELMLYQLRRADGSRDPRSSGTLVNKDGSTVHLGNDDFTQTPGQARFKSTNGTVYPVEWTIAVPAHGITLRVTTPLDDQELSLVRSTGIAYWEGMIDVAGTSGGARVTGFGYLEMTGYHGSLGRVLSSR